MNTDSLTVIHGDARTAMVGKVADKSVHCIVTSPPFWGLRKYLKDGDPNQRFEIGQEKTPEEYVKNIVAACMEGWRVLRDDGTLWLNLGDCYAGGGNGGGGSFANDGPRMTRLIGTDKNVPARKGNRGVTATVKSKRIPRGSGRWGGGDLAAPGLKAKDLVGIPWRVAFALQAAGWYLRQDIIWHKPNPMPESVTDRCTKAHEYIFLLSKSERYYYDNEAIKEQVTQDPLASRNRWDTKDYAVPGQKPQKRTARAAGNRSHKGVTEYEASATEEHRTKAGLMDIAETVYELRNKRDVWRHDADRSVLSWLEANHPDLMESFLADASNRKSVFNCATAPYREAHFATYPPALIRPCIRAGCPVGGTVLDLFGGSGTTAEVALEEGRKAIVCELNGDYLPLIKQRTNITPGLKI